MTVSDKFYVVVVMLVLTALTLALLAGHGPWSGHVLVVVSKTHGLDTGDVPVLAAWGVGAVSCWRLWRSK